ncbi:hypothetical protein ABQF10_13115, partial [Xanthomonas campestris pv. campestris]|uniref:hypothetical protein n=1 Tax=Xanthomonas campestris TaxID=339 RepID=UPI0032E41388
MAVALRRVESVIHDLRCPCRSALARDEAFLGKPPSRASALLRLGCVVLWLNEIHHAGHEAIRQALVEQLYLPVQWTGCV